MGLGNPNQTGTSSSSSRLCSRQRSNEQIFRNPHALRPRILFNFFSVLLNYPYEQIQNLSFLLQIVFELKLVS